MFESRGSMTSPFGTRTEILKTSVSEDTKEAFAVFAHNHGMTSSEALHEVIIAIVYGKDAVRSVYEKRMDVLNRIGLELGADEKPRGDAG